MALSATAALAQSGQRIEVTVPFDFVASDRKMPAGEYILQRTIEGPRVVMQLRGENDSQFVYLMIHPVRSLDIQSRSKLIFTRYGNEHFLSQIWVAGRSSGEQLRKTNRERTLIREFAKAKTNKPEAVDVAVKIN
jgi:hypothetical protein